MHQNKDRTPYFKKDNHLDNVLKDINYETEFCFQDRLTIPTKPIILIMGCPRAGSTFLLQWLANTGIFSYPSNLIARFYQNPFLGIKVQQALLQFDPLNQLGFVIDDGESLQSKLGKTIGALNPSEFWYFWRSFFSFKEKCTLRNEELRKVDSVLFLKKLGAFEQLTGKPLAMKGMIMNWHIPYLQSIYPKFLFINLKRDPFFNAQSLLLAREKYFGTREKWYSFKPDRCTSVHKCSPIDQVAQQVTGIRQDVEEGLKEVPQSNMLELNYEDVCSNPQFVFDAIRRKLHHLDSTLTLCESQQILHSFTPNNKIKLEAIETILLNQALQRWI